MSVESGPMGLPGAPLGPYARAEGMKRRHFEPAFMSWSASTHPGITCVTPKVAGMPRSTEESNTVPSMSLPV